MEKATERLNSLLRERYNVLDEQGEVAISPSDLAFAVLREIDPDSSSPALVQLAAILELKQLARQVCGRRTANDDEASDQQGLFDGKLQARYPAQRTQKGYVEDVYVRRENLTVEERWKNINQLRREGVAKVAHSDALKAETEMLIESGKLSESLVEV